MNRDFPLRLVFMLMIILFACLAGLIGWLLLIYSPALYFLVPIALFGWIAWCLSEIMLRAWRRNEEQGP